MHTSAYQTNSSILARHSLPPSIPVESETTPAARDAHARRSRTSDRGLYSLIKPETKGIRPVTPNRSNPLVAHFQPSDQQVLIAQNDYLNRDMGKLFSAQPSFETFLQSKIAQAFPDIEAINVEGLVFNRYKKSDGTQELISSEPFMKALARTIQELLANPQNSFIDEPDMTTDFVYRANSQSSVRVANASTPLHAIAREIVTQYPKILQDYWTLKAGTSPSPQNKLLALYRASLSNQAALRVADGTLSQQGKQLIDTALRYPTLEEREIAFPNGARPGVYPITLDDRTEQGAMLAGAFMITHGDGSSATPPAWPDEHREIAMNDQNGPVVLYTPGEGFEEFQTPAQMREALAQRIDNAGDAAKLLQQSLPLKLSTPDTKPQGEDLMLSAMPLNNDVIAQSMSLLLIQQQGQVNAQLKQTLAKADVSDIQAQATIDQAADLSEQFDNSNAMLARNEKLVDKQQPAWLKNLSPAQLAVFNHLEDVEQRSAAALAPLLEKIPSLPQFARDRMNEMIKRQYPNADINADQLIVHSHTQSRAHTGRPGYPQERQNTRRDSSLTDLALKNPTQWEAADGSQYSETTLSLPLLDTQKRPIQDSKGNPLVLDTEQIKNLINSADVGGEYTKLLEQQMAPDATTGDATNLRSAWNTSQSARMAQEAFLAQMNPDAFQAVATNDKATKRGLQWTLAVINHPDPATRPQVDGKDIVANALLLRGLSVQGAMVIANTHDSTVVLYTPDAPDGQAFRELADLNAVEALLDKPEWKIYTAQRQSPVQKDDNQEFFDTLKRYITSLGMNPFKALELAQKGIKTLGAKVSTKPIDGNTLDAQYKQKVQWLIDVADAQSISSKEVAQQTAVNKVMFGVEVATIFLDMVPIAGKGLSAGLRMSKAALKTLRLNSRIIPSLITRPGRLGGIYSDFTVAASGLPVMRRAPLRAVNKPLLALPSNTATAGNRPIPPSIASTSRGPIPSNGVLAGSSAIQRTATVPARDLSDYAVPQEALKNAQLGSGNVYRVGDRSYIRHTDATGVERPFEISSAFNARNGQVSIVEPGTSRRVAHLVADGNGKWHLNKMRAGRRGAVKRQKPVPDMEYTKYLSTGNPDLTATAGTAGWAQRWFKNDMNIFYDDMAGGALPSRPGIVALGVNTSPSEGLTKVLSNSKGVVLGEKHDEVAVDALLIKEMPMLAKNGVTTIFLENATGFGLTPYEASDVGKILTRPKNPAYLPNTPSRADLFASAERHNIKIVGLEHPNLTQHVERSNEANRLNLLHTNDRQREFNYYATTIIEQLPEGEKFIAVVGRSHMNTSRGVPGIAELNGVPGIGVYDAGRGTVSKAATSTRSHPPAQRLGVNDIAGDYQIYQNVDNYLKPSTT